MVENKIALLIPIRGRLELLKKMIKTWRDTTNGDSVLIFGVDEDDKTYDEFILENGDEFIFEVGPRKTSLQWLNFLAKKYHTKYNYLGFFEDDCEFILPGWESTIISTLNKRKISIVYSELNDGMPHLCGLPFVNSEFISTMGWFCPENLLFLFADNFWMEFGQACQIIEKMDFLYMEHNHYSRGENPFDSTAQVIYSTAPEDQKRYKEYVKTSFKNDVRKMITRLVELGER